MKMKTLLMTAVLTLAMVSGAFAANVATEDTSTDGTKSGWWKCGYFTMYQHNYGKTYSYGFHSGYGHWLAAYDDKTEEQMQGSTDGDKYSCIYYTSSSSFSAIRSY